MNLGSWRPKNRWEQPRYNKMAASWILIKANIFFLYQVRSAEGANTSYKKQTHFFTKHSSSKRALELVCKLRNLYSSFEREIGTRFGNTGISIHWNPAITGKFLFPLKFVITGFDCITRMSSKRHPSNQLCNSGIDYVCRFYVLYE